MVGGGGGGGSNPDTVQDQLYARELAGFTIKVNFVNNFVRLLTFSVKKNYLNNILTKVITFF